MKARVFIDEGYKIAEGEIRKGEPQNGKLHTVKSHVLALQVKLVCIVNNIVLGYDCLLCLIDC